MNAPTRRRPQPLSGMVGRLRALLEDFKGRSRFFKWRAAVITGWLVLTIASLTLFFTTVERNPIGAEVSVRTVLGNHHVFVRNSSSEPWQDVKITIPGGWSYERRTVRPGERVLAAVTDFDRGAEEEKESARDFSPATVTISTRSGTYSWQASR